MDDRLKQRLVGALVLVALAVIFLPTLFSREHLRRVDRTSLIPPAPVVQPVEINKPVRPQNIVPAKPPEQMYKLLPEEAVEQEQERAPRPALDEQSIPKAWVIQVASYKTPAEAEGLRDQLIAKGYKAYTRTLALNKTKVSRVLVGPKLSRQKSLSLKQTIDKQFKVDSMILRFQP